MAEIEQARKQLDEELKASKNGFQKGWDSFRSAEKAYKNLEGLREKALQEILEQKGLAVCSWTWAHQDWEKKENPTLKDFGIFPRAKMKMSYFQATTQDTEHFTMVTTTGGIAAVWLLCPEHFPGGIWATYSSEEFPEIKSEVVQKGNKFILKENGRDITKLIKGDRESLGRLHIEELTPNGPPFFLLDRKIYKYFGIPDLPEKPDLHNVKY